VKLGIRHGATDDYGYFAVEDKVHLHDLHATLLHLLGLDHTRLTFRHGGCDFRLTDVHGERVQSHSPVVAADAPPEISHEMPCIPKRCPPNGLWHPCGMRSARRLITESTFGTKC
jgi:hypothetical protein